MRSWAERHQVLAVAFLGGAAYIAWELKDVVMMLFFGYILAAAIRPAVDFLARYLPRVVAILLLYAAFFAALGWVVGSALVPLMAQARTFGAQFGQLISTLTHQVPFLGAVQVVQIETYLQTQAAQAAASGVAFFIGIISAVIVSIYLLYDWHALHARLHESAGERRLQRAFAATVRDSEAALGAWVRGQLVLSGAVGVLSLVALMLIGVPFAPVLAVLAFLFEFVPYAGPFLGGAPAVLMALGTSGTSALFVVVAYTLIQQLEAHVLVPIIMRRSVDLHPVVIIAVMLAAFEALGIPGVVLAVPFAVMARIAWRHLWHA